MDIETQVQILYKAVCISHGINTPGKSMNSTLLHPLIVGQTELFNLVIVYEIKPDLERNGLCQAIPTQDAT